MTAEDAVRGFNSVHGSSLLFLTCPLSDARHQGLMVFTKGKHLCPALDIQGASLVSAQRSRLGRDTSQGTSIEHKGREALATVRGVRAHSSGCAMQFLVAIQYMLRTPYHTPVAQAQCYTPE